MYSHFNLIFIVYRAYINSNQILSMSDNRNAEKFDDGARFVFASSLI